MISSKICAVALLLAFSLSAKAEFQFSPAEKGITEGRLVPHSISPDGRYALFEFNHWEGGIREGAMTITAIGIAPTDRSRLLFAIDSHTKWATDQEVNGFLTHLWNPASTLLATHDSISRNSRLNLYRIREGQAVELDTPDLLAIACKRFGISASSVKSSGQRPSKWLAANQLEISVRVIGGGKERFTTLHLDIADDGKVTVACA